MVFNVLVDSWDFFVNSPSIQLVSWVDFQAASLKVISNLDQICRFQNTQISSVCMWKLMPVFSHVQHRMWMAFGIHELNTRDYGYMNQELTRLVTKRSKEVICGKFFKIIGDCGLRVYYAVGKLTMFAAQWGWLTLCKIFLYSLK